MFETLDQIEALLGTEEGISMEFKSGLTLNDLNNGTRSELVKDVTALANAAGGTIIYGIAEQRTADGRSVADRLDPVVNQRITEDQLTMIIVSNTDPPLRGLNIRTVLVAPNSRVIVIDVEQADTAHQNRLDRRYYQRVGAISEPMYD
ncbi:ATP-binding protein [Burkholderia multivorans]|nr:ATP-binding protein [Burkholderia multivorans]